MFWNVSYKINCSCICLLVYFLCLYVHMTDCLIFCSVFLRYLKLGFFDKLIKFACFVFNRCYRVSLARHGNLTFGICSVFFVILTLFHMNFVLLNLFYLLLTFSCFVWLVLWFLVFAWKSVVHNNLRSFTFAFFGVVGCFFAFPLLIHMHSPPRIPCYTQILLNAPPRTRYPSLPPSLFFSLRACLTKRPLLTHVGHFFPSFCFCPWVWVRVHPSKPLCTQ